MSKFSYKGKRVVIVGCFSGMGEAAARELVAQGAEVHGFDVKVPPMTLASFNKIDLRNPTSIDAAVATLQGSFDAVFNCSGLPQTFPAVDVMKVNFVGMRYWTHKILPKVKSGGSIALISSTAGFGYVQRIPTVMEFINTPDFDAAVKWIDAHPDVVADGYVFSKEASTVWTMQMGVLTIKQGVRINCICPGPTETPMMADFEAAATAKIIDVFTTPIMRRSTPSEQALPLLFLCSDAASFVNGHVLNVDGGFVGGVMTGQIDVQGLVAKAMGGASAPV